MPTDRAPDRRPTHPGALLREVVFPPLGMSNAEIADRLGISPQVLDDLLAERQAVTANLAVRLGAMFGNGPRFWLNMQNAVDIWDAQREVDVSTIPSIAA